MIRHNALTIGGVSTSSFPFKVIVEDSPSVTLAPSKTKLYEHDGISGAIVQTNRRRQTIELVYTLYLVKPTESQVYDFLKLFIREGFWLENSSFTMTRWWCYQVSSTPLTKDKHGVFETKVTFTCHPTKWLKRVDSQTLKANGSITCQGSALAFPKLTIVGSSTTETSFTVGKQVIRLERLSGTVIMDNNPSNPSFKTSGGQLVKWSGDFISIDAGLNPSIPVVLGAGITSIKFDTNWGWA